MEQAGVTKQAGINEQEFEKLFSEHRRMVYQSAYSVTGNKDDAEDVLQTVFLKLIDRGRTLEFTTNPKGYLYRAAVNEALLLFRRRKQRAQSGEDVETRANPAGDHIRGQENMRDRLLEAIGQLPPQQAEILLLWADHGYTDAEIAAMVGKARGAVAVTLHRARAKVKELMGFAEEPGEQQ